MDCFKVGDWINSGGHICQILKIQKFNYDDSRLEIHTNWNVHMDYVELWEPQPDEWVLVKFKADTYPSLRPYYTIEPFKCLLDYIEPFTSQLPSWIKENNV